MECVMMSVEEDGEGSENDDDDDDDRVESIINGNDEQYDQGGKWKKEVIPRWLHG